MTDSAQRMCVFLPCGRDLHLAVPQNCLAEIVTLPADGAEAPRQFEWRGQSVPVIDFGAPGDPQWRDHNSGTGLVAVFLGLRGQSCEYWGLALRGTGLGVRRLEAAACRDVPEGRGEYSMAAFEFEGRLYQVPDLPALQAFACEQGDAVSA